MSKLTYFEIETLRPEEHLLYEAGQGQFRIKARVQVQSAGIVSVPVRIVTILECGRMANMKVGDVVFASPRELERPPS